LFWDVADYPSSELLWCLSKLPPLVDRPETTRIIADRKQVCEVLRELIEIAPFDETGHIALVRTPLDCAFYSEAQQQIEASVRRFQSEGINPLFRPLADTMPSYPRASNFI
jgi:hypothetical protein